MKAAGKTRSYHSPLRAEQARLTHARILAALRDLLMARGPEGFSFAALARRAGMTERTLFRHFPTRHALFMALWRQPLPGLAPSTRPENLRQLQAHVRTLFPAVDAMTNLARALLLTPEGRQAHIAGSREWIAGIARAVKREAPDLSPAERRRATALLHLLTSFEAWSCLKDLHQMTGAQAAEVMAWALELFTARLKRSPAGRRQRGDHP